MITSVPSCSALAILLIENSFHSTLKTSVPIKICTMVKIWRLSFYCPCGKLWSECQKWGWGRQKQREVDELLQAIPITNQSMVLIKSYQKHHRRSKLASKIFRTYPVTSKTRAPRQGHVADIRRGRRGNRFVDDQSPILQTSSSGRLHLPELLQLLHNVH